MASGLHVVVLGLLFSEYDNTLTVAETKMKQADYSTRSFRSSLTWGLGKLRTRASLGRFFAATRVSRAVKMFRAGVDLLSDGPVFGQLCPQRLAVPPQSLYIESLRS